MKTVVVGLGKVGLPVAVNAAIQGATVVGCDINPSVCESVMAGQTGMPNEAGLSDGLRKALADATFTATTDTAAAVADGAQLVIVVPPLVVGPDLKPDWRHIDSALADIGRGLSAGCETVVSVETTLPTGSSRGRVTQLLEQASGLTAEVDFYVVSSPERVYSGRILEDLGNYPKLVGGVSPEGERRAVELYSKIIPAEVRSMGSAEAAELTKLAETTYRDINIAFANELAVYADSIGVDVRQVIDAANSQPFSHIHSPGISVGGHCIPVYPHFLLATNPGQALPRAARELNDTMPAYAVDLLASLLSLKQARVLILGVTYRGDVDETAFSGAFALRAALEQAGAIPLATDPLVDGERLCALGFTPWDGAAIDGVVLHTDHAQYSKLTPEQLPGAVAIVDGRGKLDAELFERAGIRLTRIGS
jgi:UDP-N-acetyl-D-mannosaminuronic acid dehydrogenase